MLGSQLKTTNSNGFFSFRNVPGLNFILNASADGYVSNNKEITVNSDIGKDLADIILVKILKSGQKFQLSFSHIYIYDTLECDQVPGRLWSHGERSLVISMPT